ncbi:nucleoside triphosphate pyrophosphohydrolase [Pseudoalteromonas sp. SWXJZ94C]|uniref:nucleoside triphosphate pyrophosphohydrolase n=1 Tax=unclassified Pseudoalteromonas TaxID=194690 RepID=UPI0004098715|nr:MULTISPECIES: nucleoside triphosphate pyrophosphohydrolase [unclassified Pseudoalteromonas]MBH0057289.1 nucleoside triphosphate pyrophosphohydrolase [Pseudoalteromonas sp. SWXJZ94C]
MNNTALTKLLNIMKTLRDPKDGCPWDLKQDFKSIVPHTLEEAYEVADCIESGNLGELKNELGDLLFQIIFYAQLAQEQNLFDFNGVVEQLNDKLTRRHPHVFGDKKELTDEQLSYQWQSIKAQERSEKVDKSTASLWQDIPINMPSLSKAKKIQQRVASLGFDWPTYHGALDKVSEEVLEVKEALEHDPFSDHTAEEIGDLLFATVNVARHVKRDPEQLMRNANNKFSARFEKVQAYLNAQGKSLDTATFEEMDSAWDAIKKAG